MELISREEATKAFDTYFKGIQYRARRKHTTKGETAIYIDLKGIISSLPTIEEREEGEWIDAGWDGEKCSRCGWNIDDTFYSSQFLYCPNCGARMKGE